MRAETTSTRFAHDIRLSIASSLANDYTITLAVSVTAGAATAALQAVPAATPASAV